MSKIQQQQEINECLSFANKNTNANTNSNTNANENTNWLKNKTACINIKVSVCILQKY